MLHRAHSYVAKAVALITGLGIGFYFGTSYGITIGLAIIFGEYFLSPDLDIHSQPYKRWDSLRFIWIPYRKLFYHRSFWTHTPIIGSLIRILWVSPIWLPLFLFVDIGWIYLAVVAVGIETSANVHYLCDM